MIEATSLNSSTKLKFDSEFARDYTYVVIDDMAYINDCIKLVQYILM